MSFSHRPPSNRRQVYLSLAGSIEGQLRDAYAKRHAAKLDTQTSIAEKLGVDRSAVNRRLTGKTNMTVETLADMVWALGYCIDVNIFDPYEYPSNSPRVISEHAAPTDAATVGTTSITSAKLEYAPYQTQDLPAARGKRPRMRRC